MWSCMATWCMPTPSTGQSAFPVGPAQPPLAARPAQRARHRRVHGYETSGVHGALQFVDAQAERFAGRANLLVVPCVSPLGV